MWPAYCRPRRLFFGDVASVPVSEGVIPGNTYIYVYTNLYIHIHTYTIIYVHIHTYTYSLTWAGFIRQIYIHIHTYTYIYIHIHTSANHGREVFSRGCSRRPRASGWTPTAPDLLWHAMRLDFSARIVHWRLPCETRVALHGPRMRAAGWGAPNRVFTAFADGRKKWMLRCPVVP